MVTRKRGTRSSSAGGTEVYSTRSLRRSSPSTSTATSYMGSMTASQSSSVCGDDASEVAADLAGVNASALETAIVAAQRQGSLNADHVPSSHMHEVLGGRRQLSPPPPAAAAWGSTDSPWSSTPSPLRGGRDSGPDFSGAAELRSISECASFQDLASSLADAQMCVDSSAAEGPFGAGGGVTTRSAARRRSSGSQVGVSGNASGSTAQQRLHRQSDQQPGAQPNGSSQAHWRSYDTRSSPFIDLGSPFTLWEALKMAVLLPLLLPRMLLILLALLFLAACSYTATLGHDMRQPLPAWRRRLVVIGSQATRVILPLLGFRVTYTGWENVERGRQLHAIVLFNHTSFVDSIVMMRMFAPSGVAKASLASWPLVGTCISAFQNIYVAREVVDRGPSGSGGGTAAPFPEDAAAAARSSGSNGTVAPVSRLITERAGDRRYPQLAMAPEGTCSDGGCLLQFRRGAFIPGAPVLPVLLRYRWRRHNPAWTLVNEAWHALRMVCQFVNQLEVTVLPPYVPSEAERSDPGLYAANVREVYRDASGLPLVEQSQAEFIALCKAGVSVSVDGRRVTAPPGLLDEAGRLDLTPFVKPARKGD